MKNLFKYKNIKNNFLASFVIILYLLFVTINPNFFDKDYFFLIGDFSFYFDLESIFYSSLDGYYPNANGGEGGYDQIRYTTDIIIKFISFFLNEYLKFSPALINRLLLLIPAFLLIYSIYDYTNYKTKNFIISLIIAIYFSGTIFLLQNINIYIWLSGAGIIYFFKYLEKDFINKNYKSIFIVAFSVTLIFTQLRTIIFLSYFTFFYYLYFLLFKKLNLKYLLKYNIYLLILVLLLNFITIFNYLETQDTFLLTSENINLKDTRLIFIEAYNLSNINPYYILRFIINTNNATNNLFMDFPGIYYLSFINFIIIVFCFFKFYKNERESIFLGVFFLLIMSFYGTNIVKFFLINLPGLWTMSSPYHIFLIGFPFMAVIYARGFINLVNFFNKFKKTTITVISLILFSLNFSINANYYFLKFFEKKYNYLYMIIPKIYTRNFIKVDSHYFKIKEVINVNKKLIHFPILNGHYFIQGNSEAERFPLLFSFFHDLKIIYKYNYVFRNSVNKHLFKAGIYDLDQNKMIQALKNEQVKYVLLNKNIIHTENTTRQDYDNFLTVGIDNLNLKLLMKNKDFNLYEVIFD